MGGAQTSKISGHPKFEPSRLNNQLQKFAQNMINSFKTPEACRKLTKKDIDQNPFVNGQK